MRTKELMDFAKTENELKKKYGYQHEQILLNKFLDERLAEDFYDLLINRKEWDFWSYPSNLSDGGPLVLKNTKENEKKINKAKEIAIEHMKKGAFSYAFYNLDIDCKCKRGDCEICSFKETLKNFFDDISKTFNKKNSFTFSIFKYLEGNFLTRHRDKENGDMTFVFQLSKNWMPEYGGLLHFIEDETIWRTDVPQYNTMNVFFAKKKYQHFVSHVSPNVDIPRITITGCVNFLN